MSLSEEYVNFERTDPNLPMDEKLLAKILTSVILGRNWFAIDKTNILSQQCIECLHNLETFDIKEKLFHNLSEDKKALYEALISYYLNMNYRVRFIESEKNARNAKNDGR